MAANVFVAGAGGFIGGHLVNQLALRGHPIIATDIKPINEWLQISQNATNVCADLASLEKCYELTQNVDVIYHLAADVGGIGYISSRNWHCTLASQITQNLLSAALYFRTKVFFYASSACIYPVHLQGANRHIPLAEEMAVPANPEGGYGWEKLYSEHLCSYAEQMGLQVRIARLFNVYGPFCDYTAKRAKAPAALCYKVARAAKDQSHAVEVWGDGSQLRSFLYIDDCLQAIDLLMESGYTQPVNIASDEMVTIAELTDMIAEIAGCEVNQRFMPCMPTGVNARIPSLQIAHRNLNWKHTTPLRQGLRATLDWINADDE